MTAFRAYRIHRAEDGSVRAGVESLTLGDLNPGEVVVRARYSGVNYKDALAGTGRGRILRRFPLVGGIDVAGRVESSTDTAFAPGDRVLITGCGLSETRDGGYADYVRVPADCVVPLPEGIDEYEAMAIGTAGFSAALAVMRLQDNHQHPDMGPILVTGATGGVGGFAVDLLAGLGYEVHALTGKPEAAAYLQALGAAQVLDRRELTLGDRPLESAQWGGAVDAVGGEILAWLTRSVRPYGNIAAVGLAAGTELQTTVLPFILRGVSLLGIHSVDCAPALRRAVWARLADDLKPRHLARMVAGTVGLEGLDEVFEQVLAGRIRGRMVVDLAS
ncbi:acrylyl-CoA reductase family protein [Acidihalobacter prosperus]|uniref:Quinone oxidoreductase n=1 Tax=Acidihalobacter prosperus TaxID=160660 RepID=A0A1A6C4P4_9GAMM|nr:acryloyl-CoA reductase [Acidihalobacter prosperus]OBS09524.1 quinone oxidoreductase [Acidihalobacter prosperus]